MDDYTQTIQAVSLQVSNAIQSLWGNGLMTNDPDLLAAAKAPISFKRDKSQIGKMAKAAGHSVLRITSKHPAMAAHFAALQVTYVPKEKEQEFVAAVFRWRQGFIQTLEESLQQYSDGYDPTMGAV